MSEWRRHVDAGQAIIELHPITPEGRCGCGFSECESPGKHPRSKGYLQTRPLSDAAADQAEDDGLYDRGYGVLCAGLIVIDVDARNGGVESLDKLPPEVLLACGYIVETGSRQGSKHYYYKAPQGVALRGSLTEYPGLDFKSSGFVVGAGSEHESGHKYQVLTGSPRDIGEAPEALIELLRQPDFMRARVGAVLCDITIADLKDALGSIDPDLDYDRWIRVGMGIHHATQGGGFALWDAWSALGDKYPGPAALDKHWHSFGKSANPVTVASVFQLALEGGWEKPRYLESGASGGISDVFLPEDLDHAPLPGTPEEAASGAPAVTHAPAAVSRNKYGCPIDISGLDLLRPPGFVGEIYDFIDQSCLFPRPRLATVTALVAMGNIAGLRWEDDLSGVTFNLFAFCVSGSATGKEGVARAFNALHRAAKLTPAVHGKIKSTQEITRNLIRHQAAFYSIDEIGITLRAITTAQKRGGAPYLDEIIGELMKVYSKASGYYLVSGDVKDELAATVHRSLERAEMRGDTKEIERLEAMLEDVDTGIPQPFLSLIGYTTPSTFQNIMTFEQATSGFLGRSLLVLEPETNPPPKELKPRPAVVPARIAGALEMLAHGAIGKQRGRIAMTRERMPISTTPEAARALNAVMRWTYTHLAAAYAERTGLEAIARRSYEMIAKISGILAAPSGTRTLEHVRWATAYAIQDVEIKVRAVIASEEEGDRGIAMRVLQVLSEKPKTLAAIANAHALRGLSRSVVESALEQLVTASHAEIIEEPHKQSPSKILRKWSLPSEG